MGIRRQIEAKEHGCTDEHYIMRPLHKNDRGGWLLGFSRTDKAACVHYFTPQTAVYRDTKLCGIRINLLIEGKWYHSEYL